jgi:hypothetical protein
MENNYQTMPRPDVGAGAATGFSKNNTIIILLVVLLVFSFLGVNIFILLGNIVQFFINVFGPLVTQILATFGYTTGTILNSTADVVADATKLGVDIADGTVHSVGHILQGASVGNVNPVTVATLDNTLNNSNVQYVQPVPDNTTNPIQNPITSSKVGWCLIGEFQGRNSCISVTDQDTCQSGQVFPSQQQCLSNTN